MSVKNTIGNTQFGSSLKDLEDGDLERGYFDASPESPGYEENVPAGPVRHPEHIDSDQFQGEHGMHGEYGFVRRPLYRSDVDR